MTKARSLPDAPRLMEVCEATWPPAAARQVGAWTIRDGQGGGKRVSAATALWPVTDADLPEAEAAMRALGQVPLVQVRPGDESLDDLLARHGYTVIDPVNIWAVPAEELARAGRQPAPGSVFPVWPPLAMMREVWADGGIGPARLAVMERAAGPKVAIFVRHGDSPAGVAFVAVHEGIAMLHALHVLPAMRRKGVARMLLTQAGGWAVEQGATVLSLIVTRENHAANPLYASLGMQLVGHYHYRQKLPAEGATP